ncbi:MAG: alpha/beta hydrolase [Flavobacteriaceae bacterium]
MQKTLSFKNIPISYSDEGKGSVVVLLHGFLENVTMWNDLIPVLTKTNRVIAIDLLGHGNTPCLGYVHSMELMAEAVDAVLKSLRIRRVTLIGHSMGGYASLAYAEKYPATIKGFCLMNSTSFADDAELKALRERANKMVQNNFNNMVRMSFTNLFGERSRTLYKAEMELALKEALKTPLQGYIAGQEGMRIRPNRMAVLQNNSFKKLIVIGKKDSVLNYERSLEEAEKTNSETVVFDDGHMSHIENKNELIDALKTFVKGS